MAAERDIDDLPRNDANYTALTPLWFLERAALTHPARASVRYTWADTYSRCRRLASALTRRSVGHGSTVAVIAPNIPAIYEAHFGVPMAGAVVNCVNIRLNAATVAFLLEHSSAEVVMIDQEFFTLAEDSLRIIADEKKRFTMIYLKAKLRESHSVLMSEAAALALGAKVVQALNLQTCNFFFDYLHQQDQENPPQWRMRPFTQIYKNIADHNDYHLFKIDRSFNVMADALAKQALAHEDWQLDHQCNRNACQPLCSLLQALLNVDLSGVILSAALCCHQ